MKPKRNAIYWKKLKKFGLHASNYLEKENQRMETLQNNVNKFFRFYVKCLNRDVNVQKLFQPENQAYLPALSNGADIWLSNNCDYLACLKDFRQPNSKVPPTVALF